MRDKLANAVQMFQVRKETYNSLVHHPTVQTTFQLGGQIAIQEGIHEIRKFLIAYLAYGLSLDWRIRILRRKEYFELHPSSSCRLSRSDCG